MLARISHSAFKRNAMLVVETPVLFTIFVWSVEKKGGTATTPQSLGHPKN
jgi:hypothetical protein